MTFVLSLITQIENHPTKTRYRESTAAENACCNYAHSWMMTFSSLARFMGKVKRFIPRLSFLVSFLSGDQIAYTSFTFLGQDQSSSASWDDCGPVFPDELSVSSFSSVIGSHTMPGQYSPFRLRWVKPVVCCLGVTCHLLFGRMTGVFYAPLQ